MPYLICDNCEIYYEIEEDFNLDSFDSCEKCDNKLKLYNSFDDYYNDNSEPQKGSKIIVKLILKGKISKYNKLIVIGEIFVLIGIFAFIINPLSLILLFIGGGLIFYGNNKNKSWNKGIKKEYIVAKYLDQLPEDYYIFNDVKLPGSYGNIEHVVIGHNGIFIIETKNYNGHYIINNDNWFNKKGRDLYKIYKSPGKQVITNAMSLRKYLIDNDVNMDGVWVNPIVTLLNNNFEFQRRPKYYEVLDPSQLPISIINIQKTIDQDTLKKAALLVEPYGIKMYYREKIYKVQ